MARKVRSVTTSESVDLVPVSTLDQPTTELPELQSVLNAVDTVVQVTLSTNDLDYALDYMERLIQIGQLAGLALAKLMYELKNKWGELGYKASSFEDVVMARTGRAKDTVRRYVRAWGMIQELSDSEVLAEGQIETLLSRPIRDIVRVAQARSEGEFTTSQYGRMLDQPDFTSLNSTIRDIRGEDVQQSNRLSLHVTEEGQINAWKNGSMVTIAVFSPRPVVPSGIHSTQMKENQEMYDNARNRLINSTGIIEA